MSKLLPKLAMVVGLLATLMALGVWGVHAFVAVDVIQVSRLDDSVLALNRATWKSGDNPATYYGQPLDAAPERIAFFRNDALRDPSLETNAPAGFKEATKSMRYLVVDQSNADDGRVTFALFRFTGGIAAGIAFLVAGALLFLGSFCVPKDTSHMGSVA